MVYSVGMQLTNQQSARIEQLKGRYLEFAPKSEVIEGFKCVHLILREADGKPVIGWSIGEKGGHKRLNF